MKVYISGPITGTSDYLERFAQAEKDIKGSGYDCINPAKVNEKLPTATSHEEYMQMSLTMLSMCDTIYMLKGWQRSKGAKLEMQYALNNEYNIVFEGGKSEKANTKAPVR